MTTNLHQRHTNALADLAYGVTKLNASAHPCIMVSRVLCARGILVRNAAKGAHTSDNTASIATAAHLPCTVA